MNKQNCKKQKTNNDHKSNSNTTMIVKDTNYYNCPNKICDHRYDTYIIDDFLVPMYSIDNINTIDDLIVLGKTYHCAQNTHYNSLNLRLICDLIEPLTELKNMIGLKSVKENIVNHIIFFLQGINNNNSRCNDCIDCYNNNICMKNNNSDMLHTTICGPPGVGKTKLGKILGKIYKAMGILSKGHFKIVARSDLIGKYLGHTAILTQNVIDSCKGGIMFIDEAYSLGNSEGRDSFSKECIDTINQNLSEKRDFLCIIAGYENSLNDCFFNYNPGLKRRFPFKYVIDKYTAEELKDIFLIQIYESNWLFVDNYDSVSTCDKDIPDITEFFNKHIDTFPHFGGDIETFILKCKLCHSKRVLFLSSEYRRRINLSDVINGFELYSAHKDSKKKDNTSHVFMYL